jgi:hypothetical protein
LSEELVQSKAHNHKLESDLLAAKVAVNELNRIIIELGTLFNG